MRLDQGARVVKNGQEYTRLHLQINSNAENSTLRARANKDSHAVVSYADVPLNSAKEAEELAADVFEELKANAKDA